MFNALRFNLERLLLRGVHYRLLLAALIVVLVALVAGLVALILDPAFQRYEEAVWWAFLRLTDSGYLGDDEGLLTRSLSVILTVLGLLLFLGLLIAILTQWMNAWILRIESGVTPLRLADHVLILGWNHRTLSIVQELLRTKARAMRFLQAHDADRLRIVILDEGAGPELGNSLRAALGEHWDDARVMLRYGNPLRLDDLERVSFKAAAAIILPGADFGAAQPGVADAEVIKALASISQHAGKGEKPLAVAALYNSNRSAVARMAYGGSVEVVEADRIVARLMAQSSLASGLWDIYAELLTIGRGNALFVKTVPGDVRANFGELCHGAGDALLIGVIDGRTRDIQLNPSPSLTPSAGDELVFLARNYDDCRIAAGVSDEPQQLMQLRGAPITGGRRRILVLGWSRKVPLLVRELLSYPDLQVELDLVGITPVEERERDLAGEAFGSVRQLAANFLDPEVLAELNPGSYDNVILVARQRLGEEPIADAATLSAYLALDAILDPVQRPQIFVEVLEEENHTLFDQDRDDVMLSPLAVSYVLSQVALKPALGPVFIELVQSRGPSIALRKLDTNGEEMRLRFLEVAAALRARGELLIGLQAAGVNDGRVLLNPGRDFRWQHDADDRLVVLTAADREDG